MYQVLIVEHRINSQNLHMIIISKEVTFHQPVFEIEASRLLIARISLLQFTIVVLVELPALMVLHPKLQGVIARRDRVLVKLLVNCLCHFFTVLSK